MTIDTNTNLKANKTTSVIKMPAMQMFFVTLVATLGTFGSILYLATSLFSESKILTQKTLAIEGVKGNIIYYDEALTMSARMCATTGDLYWLQRYDDFVIKLDTAIAKGKQLVPDAFQTNAIKKTDIANQKLIEIETKAFEIIKKSQENKKNKEQQKTQAFSLLTGFEYETQKKIYSEGMTELRVSMDNHVEKSYSENRKKVIYIIWILGGMTPILLFSWIWTFMLIRKYVFVQVTLKMEINNQNEELQQINEELNQNVEELASMNESLEEKVNERTKQLSESNKNLNDFYEQISDSLRYAQRIQRTVFGDVANIKQLMPKSFIYLQPKDIVSGDFFYVKKINDQYSVFIAADCTGHGIPGAFMTLVGNVFLNEIFAEKKFITPDEVLYRLDASLLSLFDNNQSGSHRIQDGMDMVVVIIDHKNNIAHYSGAKNPLYMVRNNEIIKFEKSVDPIGGGQIMDKSFITYQIPLQKGDRLYLCSDGFQDQFGGAENRKYMVKKLRDFLCSMAQVPMHQQQELIQGEFQLWKGKQKQTDDILVMGIEV